jgi:hypothetical protein
MDWLLHILTQYGGTGLLFVVIVYILLRGQLTFRYPRTDKKNR